jgi:hypothetical protein
MNSDLLVANGEDTGLDSLTGRFKRNCWTMVVIRWKQKIGPLQRNWSSITGNNNHNSRESLDESAFRQRREIQWNVIGTPHNFLFFGKCKIPWRTNERC